MNSLAAVALQNYLSTPHPRCLRPGASQPTTLVLRIRAAPFVARVRRVLLQYPGSQVQIRKWLRHDLVFVLIDDVTGAARLDRPHVDTIFL